MKCVSLIQVNCYDAHKLNSFIKHRWELTFIKMLLNIVGITINFQLLTVKQLSYFCSLISITDEY
ncbi:hypothetical protein HYN43_019115 [Mucilaginibacter celer]|uniref:Uncharacterized protein n=1 Tax=Mucilaginibacter celer TaxID=2305508 RepID=A0A494W167_9SPHI|nr:hypothetical protein HYN43_019115 [Mucilaginibacter celer]